MAHARAVEEERQFVGKIIELEMALSASRTS